MAATKRDCGQAIFISFFLGVFLAAGFLPTSLQLFQQVGSPRLPKELAFPLLAALFYFSLPSRQKPSARFGTRELWLSILPPVLVAAIYGHWRGGAAGRDAFLWYALAVPFGEEFLFRGWFYNVVDRVFGRALASPTNPLPLAAWMSALGFSIWHWQNLGTDPWGWVLFQSTTTFFTGLWLAYLRWKTGSLWLPIAAHIALNAACFVF